MPGVNYIGPQPNARELLPPLLACLSTASASKHVPPGLLSLLSPILRQRVQLLSSDEWLSLLSWDRGVGTKLPQIMEKINLEPHPVSGEVEVEEPDRIEYRRSDPETLHSRLVLGEFGLISTYLWCTGGEDGDKWLLADLRGAEDIEDGTEWFLSMSEANEAGFRQKGLQNYHATNNLPPVQTASTTEEEEDDGSYWAAYDQTPSQTPQPKQSTAPNTLNRTQIGPTQSEMEYFARYASEVQPAMDAHDPDEESATLGDSTLNGNVLKLAHDSPLEPLEPALRETTTFESSMPATYTRHEVNAHNRFVDNQPEHIESIDVSQVMELDHPRPASSSSASTTSVERLERKAESYSHAELAIKQHISTDIKSLFRLARASGFDREEFEEIIRRELEVLPLLEQAME